jgi:hypothetical protein
VSWVASEYVASFMFYNISGTGKRKMVGRRTVVKR